MENTGQSNEKILFAILPKFISTAIKKHNKIVVTTDTTKYAV